MKSKIKIKLNRLESGSRSFIPENIKTGEGERERMNDRIVKVINTMYTYIYIYSRRML